MTDEQPSKEESMPELLEVGAREMELLFQALELKDRQCFYCDEIIKKGKIGGIFPSRKHAKKDIVLCKSIICMNEHIRKEYE